MSARRSRGTDVLVALLNGMLLNGEPTLLVLESVAVLAVVLVAGSVAALVHELVVVLVHALVVL